MKLSIVMPVYNEAETIEKIVKIIESVSLQKEVNQRELIIVDDYSTDGTRDIISRYEYFHKVIYHEKNSGKGKAL